MHEPAALDTAAAKADRPLLSPDSIRLAAFAAAGVGMLIATGYAAAMNDALDQNPFVTILAASGIFTLLAALLAPKVPAEAGLIVVVALAIPMRLVAVVQDPILSSDIYRYIWDGRVQAAGINPYRYLPADEALASLRDEEIYPNINRADYAPTIYPPVAQAFFLAVTRLGESPTVVRLVLIGCDLVTIAALIGLLRLFKRPVTLAVVYAWHPLAIWEVANNGHIEALMVALVMVGLWLLVHQRVLAAGVAIALGALVKPYAALVLAACWRPWDWRLPALVIAVAAACYVPYLGAGAGVFGFLSGYLSEEGLRAGDGFWLVMAMRQVVGDVPWLLGLYVTVAVATLTALALRMAFRPRTAPELVVRDVAVLFLTALFFLSPNYPWYYLMLAPFIPFGIAAPAWVLTIGGMVLHFSPGCEGPCFEGKGMLNAALAIAVVTPWILRRARDKAS